MHPLRIGCLRNGGGSGVWPGIRPGEMTEDGQKGCLDGSRRGALEYEAIHARGGRMTWMLSFTGETAYQPGSGKP